MNKRMILLLAILAASSAAFGMAEQALTDEQIQEASRQAEQESKYYKHAIKAGGVAGASIGAPIGYLAGRYAGRYDTKKMEKETVKNTIQGATQVGGLAGGAAVGGFTGMEAGANIAAWHYAKKYGVSRRVARAALLTKEPLVVPQIKQMFIDAEKRNDSGLRKMIILIAEGSFGQNWKEVLKNNFALEQFKDYQFFKFAYLLYRLNDLYYNRRFLSYDSKMQLDRAQELLKQLNIIE
jgi:hypothetical protein